MPPLYAARTLKGGRSEGLVGGGGVDMPNQREHLLVATVSESGRTAARPTGPTARSSPGHGGDQRPPDTRSASRDASSI